MATALRQSACWFSLILACVSAGRVSAALSQTLSESQRFHLSRWTTEQGLPQNTVSCVRQTRDGYLWGGTRYGLVRFDGVRFTSFTPELSALGPEALDVRSLAEDAQGRLWLQSRSTLVCWERGRFTQVPLPTTVLGSNLQKVMVNADGGLWLLRPTGVELFNAGRVLRLWRVKDDSNQPPGDADRMLVDARGRLWVRVHAQPTDSWWFRLDPQTGAKESLAEVIPSVPRDVGAMLEDRQGRLWLGRPGELLRWDGEQLARFAMPAGWSNAPVKELAEDRGGNIWLATEGPLQLQRFDGRQFSHFDEAPAFRGLTDVRCLLPDREDNVWVGTGDSGLVRVQLRPMVALLGGSFTTQDEVYSVAPGADGRVWLGTYFGVVRLQDGQFTLFTNTAARTSAGWQTPTRMVLESPGGMPWIGFDWGLCKMQGSEFLPEELPPLDGGGRRIVTSMLQDRRGTLWVGTAGGLLEQRDGQFRLWGTNEGLPQPRVFGLAEAPDGSLWVGTEKGGVSHFNHGRFRAFGTRDGLLSEEAWPLCVEGDGTAWVGTPLGLNRIRGDAVRAVTRQEGLYDNLAYCLLEDRLGRYWSFCNRGIWRVNKADLHAVADGRMAILTSVNYGESDGMASAEGNGDQLPNAARLANGEMWFPTTRGVVVVNPDTLRDNEVAPGVVIEEVTVDREVVFKDGANPRGTRESPRDVEGSGTRAATGPAVVSPARFEAGRGRVLEIRYTATTFVDAELARFRYRLVGHEGDWHEARTQREALYTNLRPGSYCFRVQAANRHGVWTKVPAEFAFSIAPHFYQTSLFYVALGLVVVGSLGTWHQLRLRSRERALRWEQERAVQEERARIAKDLHDDLGANLTGMALQVEAARRQLGHRDTAERQLQSVADSARAMVERMREVVWSLNAQCDTLESFCAFISEFAEAFLRTAGLRCRLDMPEELPAQGLSTDVRHHLLLVVKEALHNVTRHAAATEVHLGLALVDGTLRLTIADDGRGFRINSGPAAHDPGAPADQEGDTAGAGHGLQNMRRRVHALGGVFTITSAAGLGTRITVLVPLHHKD